MTRRRPAISESVSREDIRARFHGAMRDFSGPLLIRLTQIDYDRANCS